MKFIRKNSLLISQCGTQLDLLNVKRTLSFFRWRVGAGNAEMIIRMIIAKCLVKVNLNKENITAYIRFVKDSTKLSYKYHSKIMAFKKGKQFIVVWHVKPSTLVTGQVPAGET